MNVSYVGLGRVCVVASREKRASADRRERESRHVAYDKQVTTITLSLFPIRSGDEYSRDITCICFLYFFRGGVFGLDPPMVVRSPFFSIGRNI